MNILLVNKFHFLRGGSERCFFESMDLLTKKGHSVISFSMDHPRNIRCEFSEFHVNNIEYTKKTGLLKKIFHGLKSVYSFEARDKIAELIKRTGPDIAHVHSFCYQLTPSILYSLKDFGIPVILTAHEYKLICPNQRLYNLHTGDICEACKDLRFYKAISKKCIKNSVVASAVGSIEAYLYKRLRIYEKSIDAVIAPSLFLKDKLVEFGFHRIPIFHIPNFVFPGKYVPGKSSGSYILYFGRVSRNKGLMTLCRAMKNNDHTVLKIAGEGEFEVELQRFVISEGLANVEFIGYTTGKALIDMIRGSLCTVIPSEWYENCPFSILESFALGKPVIGTNIGGIPELIEDGVDGLLFEPGNVDDLRECIEWMVENKEKALVMGRHGREKIEQRYSAEKHYEQLIKLYWQVINNSAK